MQISSLLQHLPHSLVCVLSLCAVQGPAHSAVPRTPASTTAPMCADFLAKLGQKPKALEFVGCKRVRLYGVAALQSDYRVKGSFAGPVESHFVRTAGMPRLRYICCAWESLPQDVRAQRTYGVYISGERSYAVSMASRETLINQRTNLHLVDYFYITAVLYLEQL
jgi:Domian of unknown function (DUF4952)